MPYPYEKANTYDSTTGTDQISMQNNYINLTGATTAQVKTGQGYLDLVMASKQGSASVGIYDAVGTTNNTIATIPANAGNTLAVPGDLPYHAKFNNGLYFVLTSNATMPDLTVSYR